MTELQDMAKLAASYVNTTNRHIFLTGKAGTGKTTFLRYIVESTYKNTVVAAPTGIAAINAGGVTLHSLLQLPFGTFVPENIPFSSSQAAINTPQTLFKETRFNATKRKLIQELELLIIDEVSMLRADLLDCIDHTLRYLRKKKAPFGGLQILFIGDLLQLPPVVKDAEVDLLRSFYPSMYFFEARALQQQEPVLVELQKIFRQSDQEFIDLLNRLRHNEQTNDDLMWLNRYYNPDFDQAHETGYIHLTTHNYRADKLNKHKLQNLENALHTFDAYIEGDFPESMYPTTESLYLKEGAQVMFIKNDPSAEGRFFNGKIGVISNLSEEEIWVKFENGEEVLVESYKWENKRYTLNQDSDEVEEKYLGSFEQFPIKLAWAVTVHKSQGLTFEKAILDLSGTFAPGQLYVALSRLTSLKGLVLSSPIPESIPTIEASLKTFVGSFQNAESLEQKLGGDQKAYVQEYTADAFDFSGLLRELGYHERGFNKDENRSLKQKFLPWTQDLIGQVQELQKVGEGFIKQVNQILMSTDYLPFLSERMEKAEAYFSKQIQELTISIDDHRKSLKKESKVKAYLKELDKLSTPFFQKQRKVAKLTMMINCANEGKVLTKDDLRNSSVYQQLTTPKKKKIQENKTPTAQVSYELFKAGKSIEEIAEERGFVPSTIEGHLAKYVENGTLELNDVVDSGKIELILKAMEKGFEGLSELKASLTDEISYGEIKMVLAHQKKSQS